MTNPTTNDTDMITKKQFVASFSTDAKLDIANKIISDIYDRAVPQLQKLHPTRAELIMRQSVAVAVQEHHNFAYINQP